MKNEKFLYRPNLYFGYRDTTMIKPIRSRKHGAMVYQLYTLFNKRPVKGYYLKYYRELVRTKEKKWLFVQSLLNLIK